MRRINIPMPDAVVARLDTQSQRRNVSRNLLMLRAIEDFLVTLEDDSDEIDNHIMNDRRQGDQ